MACPRNLDVILFVAQLSSARDPDLFRNNINAGHQFGDGMFHLQACVHFKEVEIPVLIHQEFDRPGVCVLHRLCRFDRHAFPFSCEAPGP